MRQAALILALVSLLVAPAAVSGVAGAQPSTPDPAGTTVTIQLQADGDARWNVSVRYALDGANETAAFESLLADYRSGADVGPKADVFETVAAQQSERVGREMAVQQVERGGRLDATNGNATGVLTLTFTWTNFAVVENDSIRVADAFEGGWFGSLEAGEELLVYPPEGYSPDTATPQTGLVNGALQWEGPQSFDDGPAMTFIEGASGAGVPWMLVAGAAVVALVVGAAGVYVWKDGDSLRETVPSVGHDEGDSVGETVERDREAQPTAEHDATAESEADADAATAPPSDESGDAAVGDEESEELLSDEERVERLLEEHGGRMKQAKIVEETRWSNAKVSQLLSSMADEGRVEKLRIGRENLISLPEENGES
ncbi:helix-turn-helix transcriptional regulator [Salarchaeum japonicum]|uniref:helix-turn-helix transcriptional regulator n=1 Tax=Salarchaeum japonicum TaxID=555573 RepID=UPI003C781CBE